MRYETITQLLHGYIAGELNCETEKLQLDNDDTFVYTQATDDEEGVVVFNGGVPMELLIEVLNLLGIPNEEV